MADCHIHMNPLSKAEIAWNKLPTEKRVALIKAVIDPGDDVPAAIRPEVEAGRYFEQLELWLQAELAGMTDPDGDGFRAEFLGEDEIVHPPADSPLVSERDGAGWPASIAG